MTSPEPALQSLIDWFTDTALPLWARAGYDEARGGFHETLTFAGAPGAGPVRRTRVQARQIHVFAEAARAGLHPVAGDIARSGFSYFLEKACPDGGARGCVHLLTPEGAVADARRDLYDQAFLFLACAAFWSAFEDRRALDLAAAAMAFLDAELAAPAGGWFEDDLGTEPRRQNPHMHLFEAFMALFDATGDEAWLVRADAVFALFTEHFLNLDDATIGEFFTADWALAPGEAGDVIEPGHMAEWTALLARYGARRGVDVSATERALFRAAAASGAHAQHGFLIDSRLKSKPVADASARLWPQTEYLKAALAVARLGDDLAARAARRAGEIVEALFETYLGQPVPGLWCDRYDGEGEPIAPDVPASILYHLSDAVREAQAYLAARRS